MGMPGLLSHIEKLGYMCVDTEGANCSPYSDVLSFVSATPILNPQLKLFLPAVGAFPIGMGSTGTPAGLQVGLQPYETLSPNPFSS